MQSDTATVSAKDFRINFTKYLDLVSQGQEFIIIRRSKPIAKISAENKHLQKENKLKEFMSFSGSFADIDEKKWISNIKKNRKIKPRSFDFNF